MTNEEAVNVLRIMASGIELKGYTDIWMQSFKEAYELAIKTLEEKPKYFPPCEDCNKKMEEIRQAYDKMKAMERPQGEWEEPFERNGKTYHKCNHCHISSELTLFNNFCSNCGADMRGDAE